MKFIKAFSPFGSASHRKFSMQVATPSIEVPIYVIHENPSSISTFALDIEFNDEYNSRSVPFRVWSPFVPFLLFVSFEAIAILTVKCTTLNLTGSRRVEFQSIIASDYREAAVWMCYLLRLLEGWFDLINIRRISNPIPSSDQLPKVLYMMMKIRARTLLSWKAINRSGYIMNIRSSTRPKDWSRIQDLSRSTSRALPNTSRSTSDHSCKGASRGGRERRTQKWRKW